MAELNYVKYNRTRQDRFQIKTEIFENAGTRFVEKTALKPEGTAHIRSFEEKYRALTSQNERLKVTEPEILNDGWKVRFPYLEGKTMAELLGETLAGAQGEEEFCSAVAEAMEFLYDNKKDSITPFERTPECDEVFGSAPTKKPRHFLILFCRQYNFH